MSDIAAALVAARQHIHTAEARLLLGHILGRNHAWLEAHRDDELGTDTLRTFASLVARRATGEPVAYLLGSREFYGRDFTVAPGVLIPRPETELLVDLAKSALSGATTPRILDLGTGSGCVAVTLALELPHATVFAIDVAPAALAIAKTNAQNLGAQVRLIESDWFEALDANIFDLIVANPPYIAANDPHLEMGDLRFEPPGALASGSDGLDAIRRIVGAAPRFLTPNGRIYFEHGYDQEDAVAALLRENGYRVIEQHRDLAGIVRVSGGVRSV